MPPPRFPDLPTALVHHTSIALSKPRWGQSLSEMTKMSYHTPAVVQILSAETHGHGSKCFFLQVHYMYYVADQENLPIIF